MRKLTAEQELKKLRKYKSDCERYARFGDKGDLMAHVLEVMEKEEKLGRGP